MVRSPDRVPDMLESPGALTSAIGSAVGRLFYKRENDPRAQQADLYAAQAAAARSTLDQQNARQRVMMGLPDQLAAMTARPTNWQDVKPEGSTDESDLRLTAAQHAEADERDRRAALAQGYQQLASVGVTGEEAASLIGGVAAGWGMDDQQARYRFSGAGTALGKDDAVSIGGQDNIRAGNFRQETALNNADNATEIEKAVVGADADRYTADRRLQGTQYSANASAGASRYGADRRYQSSTENSERSAATSRANNDADNVAAGERNDADNAQSDTNNRRSTAARQNRPAASSRQNSRSRQPARATTNNDPLGLR